MLVKADIYMQKPDHMNYMTEYQQNDKSNYTGKKIGELPFMTQKSDLLLVKVFDNKTYTIDYFIRGRRDYKRIDKTSLAANDMEFHRIDPGFATWLTTQLQKYYEI